MALLNAEGRVVLTPQQKRRKEELTRITQPTNRLVHFAANVANVSHAYYSLNRRYPSPEKAMVMLAASDKGQPRTYEDWRTLLDPDELLDELPTPFPKPGVVEYQVAKREALAEPFNPSAATEKPLSRILRGGLVNTRVPGLTRDDDDIDPIRDVPSKVETWPTTGQPRNWSAPALREVPKQLATIDYLKMARRESVDKDLSPADRGRHDAVMDRIEDWAPELSERLRSIGLPVNYDSENPLAGPGLIKAYREYAVLPLYADIIHGDEKRKAKAVEAFKSLYDLQPGESIEDALNPILNLAETLKQSGISDPEVNKLLYTNYIAGRPFGQSEDKALWNYVFTYGRDKLSVEAEERASEMERNINTFMETVAKVADPGGTVTWLMDKADLTDGLHEYYKGKEGAAATAANVLHWFSHSVTHMDVNALVDRPLMMVGNMAEIAFGNYEVVDGKLVQSDNPDAKFSMLYSAEAVQAAWDAGEGKMFVPEATARIAHNLFGYELADHPAVNELLLYVGYASEIAVGAAIDPIALGAVGRMGKGTFRVSRKLATPDRLSVLRVKLADQRGFIDFDYPDDSIRALRKMIGRSNEARLEGRAFDYEAAVRGVSYEMKAEDRLAAERVAGKPKQGASFSEPQRLASEGAPILYKDGTYIVGRYEDVSKTVPGLDRVTSFDHEDLLHHVDPEGTQGWTRTRIVPDYMGSQAVWFTSGSGAMVPLEQVGRIISDLKKSGLIKDDTKVIGVAEGETVGKVLKVTGDKAGRHDFLTTAEYEEAGQLLEQLPDDSRYPGIDEGAPGPAPKAQPIREEMPGQTGIGPVEKAADGVKVVETSAGKVDVSVAPAVERLNAAGYKTFGSHGAPIDHPKGHPAKSVKPYVEFAYADLEKGQSAKVRAAAKKAGLTVEKNVDNKSLVVSAENIDGIHDFTEALTGGGVGAPPPIEPVAVTPTGPTPYVGPRIHPLLRTHAEAIAWHMGPKTQPLIRRLYRIPNGFESFLDELSATTDPAEVVRILERMRKEGGVAASFDATMPGLWDIMRASGYTKGLKSGAMRLGGTPSSLGGMHVSARNADQTILDWGYAFKMGKKEWTQADRDYVMQVSNDALHAAEDQRFHIAEDFGRTIKRNMQQEGTWDAYETLQGKVRRSRAGGVERDFRRSFTGGFKTHDPMYNRGLYSAIRQIEKDLDACVDDALRPDLEAAKTIATQELNKYRQAADIINGKAKATKQFTMADAERYIDSLGYPTPFLVGELANTMRLPFDPRIMGWYQGGTTVRALTRIDAAGWDKLVRMWKMVVMAKLSFPIRVFGKDEGVRLISEGVLPFTDRWKEMHNAKIGLVGGQRGGRWIKLSEADSDELNSLLKLEKPDEAQLARTTDLKGQAEGTLTPQEMVMAHGEGNLDLGQMLWDDFALLKPGEKGYTRQLQHNLRKISDEPVAQHFLKTNLTGREDIDAWLSALLVSDDGADIVVALVKQNVITGKQATVKGIRALLGSESRTGAAGNLRAFLDDWGDICEAISVDKRILASVKKPGSVPDTELAKVNQDLLWAVPLRDDTLFGRGIGGIFGTGTRNPLKAWYEGVTLRYMEGISSRLRMTFFSDSYARSMKELLEQGVGEERAHAIAFERGLDYTNSVTFVRNPSILEDVLRNYIPFINSYRQFWKYWGKMLLRHPYAMTAAYQYNPAKDKIGMQFPGYTVFGLPTGTFWMEQPGGLTGVIKGNTPNVFPALALAFSSLADRTGFNVRGLPGFSEDSNFNPLSSLKALAYGMHMEDIPGARAVVGDMQGYEREHAYLLKEFAADKGQKGDESGTVQTDWPWIVDVFNGFGLLGFDRPEFIMQGVTSYLSPLGTTKATPARVTEIRGGMRLFNDPVALATYRETHPDFDTLQKFYEAKTSAEQAAIVARDPWVTDYAVQVSRKTTPGQTFTTADYYDVLGAGGIEFLSNEEINRNIAASRRPFRGGYRLNESGVPIEVKAVGSRIAAEAQVKQQLLEAKAFRDRVIAAESHGSEEYATALRAQWDAQQPDKKGDALPGIFHVYAKREAKEKGIPWEEYERGLSPVSIGQTFTAEYGSSSVRPDNARDVDIQRINQLIGSGLGTLGQVSWWLKNSPYPEAIEAGQKSLREEALLGLADISKDAYYDLDSRKLRSLGVACTDAIDERIANVRNYYYNTYKPLVDKFGAASREGRDARLALNTYKDKQFRGVKGGEAMIGGLGERLLNIPYFTKPNYATVASGPHASREQKLWNGYLKEAQKRKPDMKKIEVYHDHFTPYDESRYQEFMRVNHMMYAAAMGRYLREEMRESYSEYYEGPGNSVYSNAGQKQVAKLSSLIRELIRTDKQRFGASAFAKDMHNYFESPHAFAFNALNWYE